MSAGTDISVLCTYYWPESCGDLVSVALVLTQDVHDRRR